MKTKMLLLALAAMGAAWGAVTESRIEEIAGWLPERPMADGAPLANRAAWERLAATPEGERILKTAEKWLGEPVPDTPDAKYLEFSQNGNRRNYEGDLGRRTGGFTQLYVAECLEAKGRFIPKIVEYVDAICAMKSWTLPAHDSTLSCFKGQPHVDLASSALSLNLALCSSWLGEKLPAATRAKLYAEVDRRTFQPHLRHARGQENLHAHWWFHGGNNWNSVCHAGVVRAALALVEDRRLRAEFVAHAEGSVPFALAGYTDDGYCSEGMGYWNYGYGHHIEMGLSVRAATKGRVDFFANPKTKTVMQYAYGFQIQNRASPFFADGGGNPSLTNLALGRQVWPDVTSTAAEKLPLLVGAPQTFALRAFGQEPPPAKPTMDVLPVRSWFKDAQVLIARCTKEGQTLAFGTAMKGGHNAELHNHNDVGSYTVMVDGNAMTGDPGGEIYTRRTFSSKRYQSKVLNSYGHPVPVVGGHLQDGGRAAAAKVLVSDFTETKDTFAIDYTAAYARRVPALKSLVRTFVFDRAQASYTVTDKIVCSAPTTFEVPVITYQTWTKNDEATTFFFDKTKGSRKLRMDVKASAPLDFLTEKIENPGLRSPERLAFRFREPVTEATFSTVYSTR